MDIQKPIDYLQMFHELLNRRAQLIKQRDEADMEIVKVKQLIEAIFPLLPAEKQKSYQETMDTVQTDTPGLQEAIRLLFSVHTGEWLTASDVRNQLTEMGFDFRHYQANPLSAISTTLRRMVPNHLELVSEEDSPIRYRQRATISLSALLHAGTGPRKSGTDPKPNSAYEAGMRGSEKPKSSADAMRGVFGRPRKSFGQKIGEKD